MNTLKEYKEIFVSNSSNNKNYEKNIDDFINYLDSIDIKDIREIKFENFLSSIEELFNKEIINRESTSNRYLEAIKEFYKYLKINEYAEDIFQRSTYKQDYDEFTNRIIFKDPVNNIELNLNDIEDILCFLDDYFIRFNDYEKLKRENKRAEMNRYLKYLKLRLLIKLTLLAPFKKNIITDIKFDYLYEKSRTIKINDIRLELSNSLYHNFINYKLFLSKYIINDISISKEERNSYKTYIFGDKQEFYDMLNDYLNQFIEDINKERLNSKILNINHEILRKTAIINMINSNVNIKVISKLSGNDVSTLATQYYKENIKGTIKINELMGVKYFKFI